MNWRAPRRSLRQWSMQPNGSGPGAPASGAEAGIECSEQPLDTKNSAAKPAASINLANLLRGGSRRILITASKPISKADLRTKPLCVVRANRSFRPTLPDLVPIARAINDGYIAVLVFADDDHAEEFEASGGPELIDRIIGALRALRRPRQ
jgi:hypothetical protein